MSATMETRWTAPPLEAATPNLPSQPRRRKRRRYGQAAWWFLLLGALGYAGWWGRQFLAHGPANFDRPLSTTVQKTLLRVVVAERGNVESVKTVDGACELRASDNKIIQLVPEGTKVKKGDIVCVFDSSQIDKNIAEQEIKVKQAATKIETTDQEVHIARSKGETEALDAEVEYQLAELDVNKYEKGDYLAEIEDLNGNIALAKKELEDVADKLEQFRALVKKGFKSPEQLRSIEQEYSQRKNYLARDEQKLKVKQLFEKQRKSTEYQSKVRQAAAKLSRAKATAKAELAKTTSEHEAAKATHRIELNTLEMLKRDKEKCTLRAEQAGIVAYANEPWYDSGRQIREGATVWNRQKIFSLPDMSAMQVNVTIHESVVKKVKVGQTAEIRIEALPHQVLSGVVKSVSNLADSTRFWESGGAKQYKTVVTIDRLPGEELKPGMTAEVRILVRELPDVLSIPIQAVAEHKGEHYAFREQGDRLEMVKVKLGDSNDKLVQVLGGLGEGQRVTLDARTRLDQVFSKDIGDVNQTKPPAKPSAPIAVKSP